MKSKTGTANYRKYATPVLSSALVLLVLAVYWQTVGFGYIELDDPANVTQNNLVRGGLSFAGIAGAFTSHLMIPLTWISYMADVSLFGMSPGVFHRTNVILFGANAVVLFLFLRAATGSTWRSFFAAALWAMHPLRVESVAWISERKDVLSGLFFLLALWSYLLFSRTRKPGWYALLIVFHLLGLLAKPVLVVLPGALLMLDFWPLGRFPEGGWKENRAENPGRLKGLILEKIPLIALSAAFVAIYFTAIVETSAHPRTFFHGFANAVTSYWKYLGRTFFPSDIIFAYDPPGAGENAVTAFAALAALAAASLLAFRFRKKAPEAAFGWFWYLLVLIPNSGLVYSGIQSFADRYTYLPHIGIAVALTWGAARLAERIEAGERMIAVPGAAAVILLAALSYNFTGYWKNSYTLFGHVDEASGGKNSLALVYLATASMTDNNPAMVLGYLDRLLKTDFYPADAVKNKVTALYMLGRYDEALDFLRQELKSSPGNPEILNMISEITRARARHLKR